jgi:gamma-glutamyltranspeptidase / glutathione hydrolase
MRSVSEQNSIAAHSAAHGPAERAAGVYSSAAVAHEHPASAEAGVRILRGGGNAVDAAVAVSFAACVVMPAWTTIAGSGFMLVHGGAGADPVAIEFGPRAPLAASPDMYELECNDGRTALMGVAAVVGDANVRGARAVGVPAVVAGLCEAQARFGRLPLADVLAPAIELARHGFATDPDLQMQTLDVLRDLRDAGAEARGTLLTEDGFPLTTAPGSDELARVMQAKLADTLEAIARDGADGFYRGPPGEAIVAEVQRRGGVLTLEDLARVQATVTRPLSIRVGDATIWGPTSPCGGWTELQTLAVLARLDGLLDGRQSFDLWAYLEASRRCFADRFHFMGDPEHVDVPLDLLLSDHYLDALAAEVAATLAGSRNCQIAYPDAPPWVHYAYQVPEAFARCFPGRAPTPWQHAGAAAGLGDSFETTHLCTQDEDGMAVSCTITAAHQFGSRVIAAGVVLDDAMIWFNAAPGAANSIAPWKRPLVNMGPLIVCHDDGRTLAVGAPGGRRIISAVSQVVAHWLRGDSVEEATARPRIDGSGGTVIASRRLKSEQVERLRAAGFAVQAVEDRDRFCVEFARPVAVASTSDGRREAAVQPYVRASVAGL